MRVCNKTWLLSFLLLILPGLQACSPGEDAQSDEASRESVEPITEAAPPPPPPEPVFAPVQPIPPVDGDTDTPLKALASANGDGTEALQNYKVELGVEDKLSIPGTSGQMWVWIGHPQNRSTINEEWTRDTAELAAHGHGYAKVEPRTNAQDAIVFDKQAICMGIVPEGTTAAFTVTPKEAGSYQVGAYVRLYNNSECEGASINTPTTMLNVEVTVDRQAVWLQRLDTLAQVVWDKFVEFWGWVVGAFFAVIAFLIRKRIKRRFGIELPDDKGNE